MFELGDANRSDWKNVVGYYNLSRGYVHLNTATLNMRIKKIACLGDSITEGGNANGWPWHRYIDQWCKNNGIETTVVNLDKPLIIDEILVKILYECYPNVTVLNLFYDIINGVKFLDAKVIITNILGSIGNVSASGNLTINPINSVS